MAKFIFLIILLFIVIISVIIIFRKKSKWHIKTVEEIKSHKPIAVICIILVILCCILPMNLSPIWNGEIETHRNQYEKITESFLNGHLYFDYEVDEKLLELDNPYDPEQRKQNDVEYHADHAFYNGKYYMYFGVVPVILTFLPYRVITGHSLTTYHATQIYTALFILFFFYCAYLIAKKWLKNIPISMYLLLSSALSVICVWNAVSTPAMYCTAVTSGLAFMMMSIAFWMKAAWFCESEKKSMLYAVGGSICGALVFGCRPPIGLGNILILVLMWYYFRNRNDAKHKALKFIMFALPYIIIGVLLMWYNYARFGSIFEFGQSYQLTLVDVKNMPTIFNQPSLVGKLNLLYNYFCEFLKYFVRIEVLFKLPEFGMFLMFPILWYIIIGLENENVRTLIKRKRTKGFVLALIISIVLIIMLEIISSPLFYSRYRMDTYWLFGMLTFYIIASYYQFKKNKHRYCVFICALSVVTILTCVVMFACPYDQNFTGYYIYDILKMFHIN